jgi:hypothetical protein
MNLNDVKKITLITKTCLYEWLVMPIGIKNAIDTFSKTMINIFFEWLQQFLKVFVNDFNIHSVSWETHLDHICMVQHLQDVNLKFDPNKCMFFAMNIKFLGHVVGKARTQPNLNKVKTMVEFSIPRTITNIQAFLGLTRYYRNYVRGYVKLATLQFELTKRDATLLWNS